MNKILLCILLLSCNQPEILILKVNLDYSETPHLEECGKDAQQLLLKWVPQIGQILDEKKDQDPLLRAKKKFEFIISNFPNSDYAVDSRFKIELIIDQLAAKEMYIARFYMKTEKWIPALNRLKVIVNKYDKTIFIEEALHRLVEVYYKIGLVEEAQEAAAILGYNYQSSQWYERSYKVFNNKYKMRKIKKKKEMGLIRKKIKSLFQ